jgi:hypothetical protein
MSIPWYYIWSENVFKNVMENNVTGFDLKPIQSNAVSDKDRAAIIVDCLKNTSAPYIIFSVSELVVKSEFISELPDLKDDMVFMGGPKNILQTGLLYLKNTSDVIEFWSSLTSLEESILSFNGKWSKFSKCVTTDTWDKYSNFNVLQIVPSNLGNEFNFAETIFTMAQYIDFQQYMQYVPEQIVPFIYKIQELLFLTHKEMKVQNS